MVTSSGEFREYDEQLDLRQLLSSFWRGRRIVIASVLFFTLAFAAVAFLMTPMYAAYSMLVPASSERAGALNSALGSLGSLASIAGINVGNGDTQTQEALAVMRSRAFTEAFIAELNLLPELYADQWDAAAGKWRVPADEQPTLVRAYKYFDRLRTVAEEKKTGLIRVEIEWRDPSKAALWVNELVARLNAVMRARAIERSEAHIGYLQQELAVTTAVETRNAIGRLMESNINERMLANVNKEYAFRVADKALAPDPRDPVRPKKALLIACGMLTGIFIGCIAVLLVAALRAKPRARSAAQRT